MPQMLKIHSCNNDFQDHYVLGSVEYFPDGSFHEVSSIQFGLKGVRDSDTKIREEI